MQNFLQRAVRFFRAWIGWNRVGVIIGVSVTIVASIVLYRMLHDIEPREVLDALKGAELRDLVMAGLLVAAGYLTLTFYDYFALRTIGRTEVPYRIAAVAGFTSYSIGHNIGFSAISGGTVRYRIYSTANGLSAIEVTKICFVAGLTFWLGNITVLGLGLVVEPAAASAIDHLPIIVNQIAGLAALALLTGYVIWVSLKQRYIGAGVWKIGLPSGTLTFVQILIGIVDLTFCAAAMYTLMPDKPDIEFIPLAVIFVAATLLGFASHTPGGLGVFDAAMLLALRQFDKEGLVGALLLFRLFYYVIPFAISLAIIGLREFVLDLKPFLGGTGPLEKAVKREARGKKALSQAQSQERNMRISRPARRQKNGRGKRSRLV